ncbi:MAG: HEAT repeat domain-containing protein [Anaerolineae bacterium]|nr:HEAT repeat domain-containing protein [Anaerolineae bacterium]
MSHTEPLQNNIDELIAKLKDKSYRVRREAAYKLGETGDARAIEPLLDTLGEFDSADEDSKVNQAAGDALVMIGEAAIVPLINALKKDVQHPKDGWRRYWVTDTLGMTEDARVVEPLIKALEDEDKEVVEGAADALERIGDRRAIEPLMKALSKFVPSDGYVYTAISLAIESIRQHKQEA